MRRGLIVFVLAAAVLCSTPSVAAAATGASCTKAMLEALGFCPQVGNDGSQVKAGAEQTSPGTSPSTQTGDHDTDTEQTWDPAHDTDMEWCFTPAGIEPCFLAVRIGADGEPLPAITITDLAIFAPTPSTTTAEPDNIGIANMPTNFTTTATTHTQTGTLFGRPLTVRFTPTAYDYTYGDGTTATITTPGHTWQQLGQAQFTPTPTSHTYTHRGTYNADVDVRYAAEIDFGTGWYPITGELTTDGAPQQIRIFEAHTALVAHTCTQQPAAPGC